MTKEKAKKIAKGITDKIEASTADIDDWAKFWGFTRKDYEEFLEMPIKIMEQKPSLNKIDKIRAEIVDLGQRTMNDNGASGIWACRDIIDKYKAESNIEKHKEWPHKPCINYEDDCEVLCGCPCVYHKAEK